MLLLVHISVSLLSLLLHGMLFAKNLHAQRAPSLTKYMYGSIVAAVASGGLLLDGSAKGYAHGVGMLGVLAAFHIAFFVARRTFAPKRSQQ